MAASDEELVMFLISHITNPCEVEIYEGQRVNIRDFYIREAKRILPTIKNPTSRRLLELAVSENERQ